MTKQKKLFNKTGDSVEIKEEGKDVIVTVQYTTKGANDVNDAGQL
jgi:hypothetical protein